jgi:hypothetical protein
MLANRDLWIVILVENITTDSRKAGVRHNVRMPLSRLIEGWTREGRLGTRAVVEKLSNETSERAKAEGGGPVEVSGQDHSVGSARGDKVMLVLGKMKSRGASLLV